MSTSHIDLTTFERRFDSLVSEVKLTHAQFEELLSKHAKYHSRTFSGSQGSKDNTDASDSSKPSFLTWSPERSLKERTMSRPELPSMILAGLSNYRPTTTPVPFRLITKERAENRAMTVVKETVNKGSPSRLLSRTVSLSVTSLNCLRTSGSRPQGTFSKLIAKQ